MFYMLNDPPLLAAVLEARGYVVGAANAPSGLYRRVDGWEHLGWRNLRATSIAVAEGGTLFLGAGNGVLRTVDGGATWRVTTDWRVTEVLDVALDPFTSGGIVAASAFGLWRSHDGGEAWAPLPPPAPRPDATFMPAVAFDRQRAGRLLVGTEAGLFASDDGGEAWQPVGPRGAVRALAQSEACGDVWLAGTAGGGVLVSSDGGATWSGAAEGATVWAVASDPTEPRRMAAAGLGKNLLVSTDGGARWRRQPLSVSVRALHALAFDPRQPGRLWLGSVGDGLFVTDDLGRTCSDAGLPETTVYGLAFAAP